MFQHRESIFSLVLPEHWLLVSTCRGRGSTSLTPSVGVAGGGAQAGPSTHTGHSVGVVGTSKKPLEEQSIIIIHQLNSVNQ